MGRFDVLVLSVMLFFLAFVSQKTRDRFIEDVIKKTEKKLITMR